MGSCCSSQEREHIGLLLFCSELYFSSLAWVHLASHALAWLSAAGTGLLVPPLAFYPSHTNRQNSLYILVAQTFPTSLLSYFSGYYFSLVPVSILYMPRDADIDLVLKKHGVLWLPSSNRHCRNQLKMSRAGSDASHAIREGPSSPSDQRRLQFACQACCSDSESQVAYEQELAPLLKPVNSQWNTSLTYSQAHTVSAFSLRVKLHGNVNHNWKPLY